jgi:hypothetical protein
LLNLNTQLDEAVNEMNRKNLSLTVVLASALMSCSGLQQGGVGRAPDSRSPSALLEEKRKINCSDPAYARETDEFSSLFRRYLGVLDDTLLMRLSQERDPAQKARVRKSFLERREQYRWEILHYVSTRDSKTCFTPDLDIMNVCAQLHSPKKLVWDRGGLKIPLKNGFDLVRTKKFGEASYSNAWKLVPRKDATQIAAMLSDRDNDGFIDDVYLAGKLTQKTSLSSRNFFGISWDIEETDYGFSAGVRQNLYDTELGDALRYMDSGSLCSGVFGSPERVLERASLGQGWVASEAVVTRGQIASAAWSGFLSGYQVGTRGAVIGAVELAKGTAQGIYVLGKGAIMGVGSIARALSRESTYQSVFQAFRSYQNQLGDTLASCYLESGESLLFALECTESHYLKRASELGAQGASRAKDLGAQLVAWTRKKIQQCTTVSGNEESFAECMGQLSFLSLSSAAGGGVANVSSRLALTSTNAGARILGRAGVIAAEWLIDPIGLGTLGVSKVNRLSATLKRVQKDLPKLAPADELALRSYLEELSAHALRGVESAPPRLDPLINEQLKKAGAWEAQDLAALMRGALDDVSAPIRKVRDELSLVTEQGVRHSPAAVEATLLRVAQIPAGAHQDFALSVVRRLAPRTLSDPIRRNTTVSLIDRAYQVFSRQKEFALDPDRLARAINSWDPAAIEAVERTFVESAEELARNPSRSMREVLESELGRRGRTRDSITQWMGCVFDICARAGGVR